MVVSFSAQEKEIAVTIDDLPLNGPQFEAARLRKMTDNFLVGIKKHRVPAVGFVNESLLYVPNEIDERISILKSWVEAEVELGNHTFSHLGFKTASLPDYQDDFIRGESVTKMLMKGRKIRYFRHPFLQMGATLETEKAFEDFIGRRGYRIAPVTVDTMDWMFLAAYAKARKENDKARLKRVSDEYLKYVGIRFDYSEKITNELFGRPIKHILLIHSNELNADNFDALMNVIKDKGYRFITLEQALQDPVYQFPDKYNGTSDWLSIWAFSKGRNLNPPAPPGFIQKIFNGK
jgi:peptidoglycan/xylan/chitin deacetylase (PgdA/CDA1 family)